MKRAGALPPPDLPGDPPPCRISAPQRVFEAARELFYRRGIRAVGVDEIVARAGVTKPSLYRSYPSKDALVAACLARSAEEAEAAMAERIAAHAGDPPAQLRAVVGWFAAKAGEQDFRGCAMSNAAVEFPEAQHPARVVLLAAKQGTRGRLASVAADGGARDPQGLADALLLLIEGALASRHIFGPAGPARAMADAADTLIERAFRR